MDTAQKIMEASIIVFTERGYLGATTKEIAATAGVSEMTLFRKFQTKQNLFNIMIKSTLGEELLGTLKPSLDLPLIDVLNKLIHSRLMIISSKIGLIRMIIQESIQGFVPEELDFITQISKELKETLSVYQVSQKKSAGLLGEIVSGFLLQYAILTPEVQYHLMTEKDQKKYIQNFTSFLQL